MLYIYIKINMLANTKYWSTGNIYIYIYIYI